MDTKRIIDISMDLNEKTVVWIQDQPPQLKPIARMPKDSCNFTWLDFGSHAGTHIDAPFYLFNDKWKSDQIPLTRLIGTCQVLDLSSIGNTITKKDLQEQKIEESIILIKTKNSYDPLENYNPKHIDMDIEAAKYLIEKGVQTLGYDYQSFEREGKNLLHHAFLSHNVTIIDNLRLKEAEAKKYLLICLPLKVTGIDAAPARAILMEENHE